MRHIADFFQLPYNPNPQKGDPISVSREEFDAVYDELRDYGIAMKPDRDKAWEDFVGWRVNYELGVCSPLPCSRWPRKRLVVRPDTPPERAAKGAR